jgi:excisionase family DNA binding protein
MQQKDLSAKALQLLRDAKRRNAPQTYSVDEVAEILGVSRPLAYEGCARGEIPCVRIGRRILVPRSALEAMLRGGAVQQELPLDTGEGE